jgi:hypothetical protein
VGDLYRKSPEWIAPPRSGHCLVEIGTARGQGGSTHYFAELAYRRGQDFYTIDVEARDDIVRHVRYPMQSAWMPGSEWVRRCLPDLGLQIDLLYLDNFDWDYSAQHRCEYIEQQKQEYQSRGVAMTNQASVREHLAQIIGILPYMAKSGVVICDDTYLYNDCWIGKGGAVVPYLQAHGYTILAVQCEVGESYGVAMQAPA